MLAAIGKLRLDYKVLLSSMVCRPDSRDCMLHLCDDCPGKEHLLVSIQNSLRDHLDMDAEDEITFSQWSHTDRPQIVTQQTMAEQFVELLVEKLDLLRIHHFIANSQARYLTECKETLDDGTAIVLMDFAENYSFIVQDSIQGFYWDNSQATIHPFGIYYMENDVLCKLCVAVISDCMKHDAVSVHTFITVLMELLKTKIPALKLVKYWSDGAASQYKNCKNLKNLCCHKEDFDVNAEWHFFATSHGKSVCDGIGGTVKQLAARASLQHATQDHILTPMQLFTWACAHVPGITFRYVSAESVAEHGKQLEPRLKELKTVAGTRTHHCFLPDNSGGLKLFRVSSDKMAVSAELEHNADQRNAEDAIQPGKYAAVVYDHDWFLGYITERSEENRDILVDFMHPKGPARSFKWPRRKDQCWAALNHVLCVIPAPATSSTGRQYTIDETTGERITEAFEAFSRRNF